MATAGCTLQLRELFSRVADADHPEGQKLALLFAHRHVLADLEGVVAKAETFLLRIVLASPFHPKAQVEPPRPPA